MKGNNSFVYKQEGCAQPNFPDHLQLKTANKLKSLHIFDSSSRTIKARFTDWESPKVFLSFCHWNMWRWISEQPDVSFERMPLTGKVLSMTMTRVVNLSFLRTTRQLLRHNNALSGTLFACRDKLNWLPLRCLIKFSVNGKHVPSGKWVKSEWMFVLVLLMPSISCQQLHLIQLVP